MKPLSLIMNNIAAVTVLIAATCFGQASIAGASKAPASAQACASCHGAKGLSQSEVWPNLAGQKPGYLALQLRNFRDGKRSEATMFPFVKNLSDSDIDDLAQYFSSLPVPESSVATQNQAGKHVRSRCISCHGMSGNTVNDSWPNLAGQKSAYLLKQLKDYRSGKRQHPIMEVIAKELNDQQSADVAEFFSQQ